MIRVYPAYLLGFKIPSFIIPQYIAEVYSVHLTNPNTHKLLKYHVSSNTLLPQIDPFHLIKCHLKVKGSKLLLRFLFILVCNEQIILFGGIEKYFEKEIFREKKNNVQKFYFYLTRLQINFEHFFIRVTPLKIGIFRYKNIFTLSKCHSPMC